MHIRQYLKGNNIAQIKSILADVMGHAQISNAYNICLS